MTVNILLFFFAAFAINLMLHLGLGVREMFFERDSGMRAYVYRAVNMVFSVLILWHLFVYILYPLTLGFLSNFLLYPLCFLLHYAFSGAAETLKGRRTRQHNEDGGARPRAAARQDAPKDGGQYKKSASSALFTLAALIYTLNFALTSIDALLLSCGFAAGLLLAALALKAIRLRISKENAPLTLRGLPLMLISAALLALIFSALAGVILTQ